MTLAALMIAGIILFPTVTCGVLVIIWKYCDSKEGRL